MTASVLSLPDLEPVFTPRQRDRRAGLGDVLVAIARAANERGDPYAMRAALEGAVKRLIPVRSVRLCNGRPRVSRCAEGTGGAEAVALEVPGPGPRPYGVLEARFDPPSSLGEWDFQVLATAAQAASLVLEIERCRGFTTQSSGGALGAAEVRAQSLVGGTEAMEQLRATIERVADTDFTVLIEGESGVGKELVARQIHQSSRRRDGPFVAINCAALVETLLEAELFGIEDRTATGVRGRRGKFEQADGGTLFLDEVSDLSLAAQAKLLRAIQDLAVERVGGNGVRHVDIRIVAATNRALKGLVERGLFRADLYYRLSGVDIHVPALRDRRADIMALSRSFLDRHDASLRLSIGASDALLAYDWPGNVRELERMMERAVTLAASDVIGLDDLPAGVRGEFGTSVEHACDGQESMRAWTSRYARLRLERCKGNKREACRILGISYHTLVAYLNYEPGRERARRTAAEPAPATDSDSVSP